MPELPYSDGGERHLDLAVGTPGDYIGLDANHRPALITPPEPSGGSLPVFTADDEVAVEITAGSQPSASEGEVAASSTLSGGDGVGAGGPATIIVKGAGDNEESNDEAGPGPDNGGDLVLTAGPSSDTNNAHFAGSVLIAGGAGTDADGPSGSFTARGGASGFGEVVASSLVLQGAVSSGGAGSAIITGGTGPDGFGGDVDLRGGPGGLSSEFQGCNLIARNGSPAGHGRLQLKTNAVQGAAGEALVSDGAQRVVYGGVQTDIGAPSGAPDGFLPLYLDTADGNALYVWDGSAWQGPYVVTP